MLVRAYGGPEEIELVEGGPIPEPGPGQLRLRVRAASLSFHDVAARKGRFPIRGVRPPFVPGFDCVGEIDAVGAGVTSLREGQMVAALTQVGGQARFVCVPADMAVRLPSGVDLAEAAVAVSAGLPALRMVKMAAPHPGQSALVQGAAGGIGSALVALLRLEGVAVFGTCSEAKADLVSSLGATPIAYLREPVAAAIARGRPGGVDLAFDGMGGVTLEHSFGCLAPGGLLIQYGSYAAVVGGSGGPMRDGLRLALFRALPGKRARRFSLDLDPAGIRADLTVLLDKIAAGQWRPVVHDRWPLRRAAEAQQALVRRTIQGRLVLEP